jgi:putative peptide zinc metalloprotease protein
LTDLIRHKFFHLGQSEIQTLAHPDQNPEDAEQLAEFLTKNELVMDDQSGKWKAFSETARRSKQGLTTKALHGYLFFRIPLINPHQLLPKLWPIARPFFTKTFAILSLLVGVLGLFFISRHWQDFIANFATLFSFSGLTTYALAFVVIKILHEAGHAFMAHRFAIPVPHIGIAFMLFTPVLYTETSAAWRLNKRKRMFIGAAGMMVELTLALWASLIWVFVPDGVTRSILFAIATTGWFLTLAVNLNPLMRFDGYFLASDLVSMPNLQDRSFALARWAMRELLFSPGEEKPEDFSTLKTTALIAFAIATWIYRLFLYLGIALLVYHFAVKILGIFLFAVEIAWFIVLPLWREAKHWWKHRSTYFSTPAAKKSALVLFILCLLFFLPLSTTTKVPAFLTATRTEQIHTKSDTIIRVSHLKNGLRVAKGDVLLELDLPDLAYELAKADASIRLAKTKLARLAVDLESRSQAKVIEEELSRALQNRKGIEALKANSLIKAPFDGTIENVAPGIGASRWIGPQTTLAIIKSNDGSELHALATDAQVIRLKKGASATFIPDDFMHAKLYGTLEDIDRTGSASLPHLELADKHGGPIPTTPSQNGNITPTQTLAKLKITLAQNTITIPQTTRGQTARGQATLTATPESLATKTFRKIAGVLIMESGF